MNSVMKLFSKELVEYVYKIYLKNHQNKIKYAPEGKLIGWCRCCGEPIRGKISYRVIPSNLTASPDLARDRYNSSTFGFVIHAENCCSYKKEFKLLADNSSLNSRMESIQLNEEFNGNLIAKKGKLSLFEKSLNQLNKKRLEIITLFKGAFENATEESEIDSITKIMDRLRIVGNHIRLSKNEYQQIKQLKGIKCLKK